MLLEIKREDLKIINNYGPNNRTPKQMKQKLIETKTEIDNSILIARDFNTPFSIMDRTTRHKVNKEKMRKE